MMLQEEELERKPLTEDEREALLRARDKKEEDEDGELMLELEIDDPMMGLSACMLKEKEIRKGLNKTKDFLERYRDLIGQEETERKLTLIQELERDLSRLNEKFMGNLEALTRRGDLLKELVNNSHQLSSYAQRLEQEVNKKNEKMKKNSCLFM